MQLQKLVADKGRFILIARNIETFCSYYLALESKNIEIYKALESTGQDPSKGLIIGIQEGNSIAEAVAKSPALEINLVFKVMWSLEVAEDLPTNPETFLIYTRKHPNSLPQFHNRLPLEAVPYLIYSWQRYLKSLPKEDTQL